MKLWPTIQAVEKNGRYQLKEINMKKTKMDPKLIAAKQKHEISYIAKRHKIPMAVVSAATKKVGRSRAKVYAELRKQGYTIKTR